MPSSWRCGAAVKPERSKNQVFEFVFVSLCVLAIVSGLFARWFVRRRAPFYEPANILVAGLAIGVGLSLILSALASETDLGGWRLAAVHAVALAAIGLVAISPEPIDSANKTLQVALVAGLSYATCSFVVFLLVFGSYFFG